MTDLALLILLDPMASIVSHIRMFRWLVLSLIVMTMHSLGMENRQTDSPRHTWSTPMSELTLEKFTVLNVVTMSSHDTKTALIVFLVHCCMLHAACALAKAAVLDNIPSEIVKHTFKRETDIS